MFIKTRQSRGQIFYLGSAFGSFNDETYIATQLEGGELLMRIHFNGTTEAYTVGGVKLNNGYNHLIQVVLLVLSDGTNTPLTPGHLEWGGVHMLHPNTTFIEH